MAVTTEHAKPVPVPDEASLPFFEGARRHELMLQRCTACGAFMWPVKPRCVDCFAADPEWAASSGRGTLYTFAIVHQLSHPGFADDMPYNVAVVELEEGVRMTTNIVGCDDSEFQIGMSLEVRFEAVGEEFTLPRFRPSA